ncbi:MAG: LacI family DNA-binding transcriptional regulator [Firmicutes bacterium]|nr:LacI family DNA-binding transcriptional regulator [Bacillota bacterium]
MITLKDIAQAAGVSQSTVSRILNQRPGISGPTRERVLEIAASLNYHPNDLARGLAGSATNIVGVIFPRISNLYYAQLLQGIQEVAGDLGYTLVLCITNNDVERALKYLQILKGYRSAGVIYLNAYFQEKDQEGLLKADIPAIIISRKVPPGKFYSIVIDEFKEASRATRYLIELGHRRLAFIGGPLEDPWPGQLRLAGFRETVQAYGLDLDPSLITQGDWTFGSGVAAMKRLLANGRKIDAVFAASDEMAIGAMKAAQAAGLSVPGDISVIGFDGVPLGIMCTPELTTIEQPITEMGRTAMSVLHRLIQKADVENYQFVLPCRLVERASCRRRED